MTVFLKHLFTAFLHCLLVLLLYVPVNSYGHYGTDSSPNHTFSCASLNKRLTITSCTYFHSYLTTTLLNDSFSGKEENDHRNYFMINLHESMGPCRDRTHDPWICSQTHICSQTLYRLHHAAWHFCIVKGKIDFCCNNLNSDLQRQKGILGSYKN